MTRRCGLYVRVSTDRQVTEEGSLKSQTQRLREEIGRRTKLKPDEPFTETRVYREEGVSGKDLNRPAFLEMVNDIKTGVIDTVVVTELSRVSRSVIDFLNFAQFLDDYKAGFVCLKQSFDTTTPHGRVLITICIALAQFERELTSERTSENLLARARRGLRNGGQVIGYDPDPNKKGAMVPNEAEAKLVNLIFDKYLELGSVELVARWLNQAGYRTKGFTAKSGRVHKPHKFSPQLVHWILNNRAYIGVVEINRMQKTKDQSTLPEKKRYATAKAVWPAIVDEGKFNEVYRLMRQNGQIRKNAAAKVIHNYILRGLAHCATCGCFLEDGSGTSESGTVHFYYRHPRGKKCPACDLPSLRAETLESIVLSRLSYLAERKDIIEAISEEANNNLGLEVPRVMGLLGERKREYARLTREMDQYAQKVLDLESTDLTSLKEILAPKVDELKTQRAKVSGEIELLQKSLDELKGNVISAIDLQETLQSFGLLYAELQPHKQRELLGYIIKSINVSPKQIEMALFGRANLERFTRSGEVFAGRQNWLPEAYSPQKYPVSQKPFVLWDISKCLTIRARHGRQKIVNNAAFQTHKTIRDKAAKKPALPRIQGMLAQGHVLRDRLKQEPELTKAALAREFGIDPVLLTRMVRLANLAPEIQQHIQALPPSVGRIVVTERRLRPIAKLPSYRAQLERFRELLRAPVRARKTPPTIVQLPVPPAVAPLASLGHLGA